VSGVAAAEIDAEVLPEAEDRRGAFDDTDYRARHRVRKVRLQENHSITSTRRVAGESQTCRADLA